jgi:hypothetical protein
LNLIDCIFGLNDFTNLQQFCRSFYESRGFSEELDADLLVLPGESHLDDPLETLVSDDFERIGRLADILEWALGESRYYRIYDAAEYQSWHFDGSDTVVEVDTIAYEDLVVLQLVLRSIVGKPANPTDFQISMGRVLQEADYRIETHCRQTVLQE